MTRTAKVLPCHNEGYTYTHWKAKHGFRKDQCTNHEQTGWTRKSCFKSILQLDSALKPELSALLNHMERCTGGPFMQKKAHPSTPKFQKFQASPPGLTVLYDPDYSSRDIQYQMGLTSSFGYPISQLKSRCTWSLCCERIARRSFHICFSTGISVETRWRLHPSAGYKLIVLQPANVDLF